jgi:hypothetical protein
MNSTRAGAAIYLTSHNVERHFWINPQLVLQIMRTFQKPTRPLSFDIVVGEIPYSKARNTVVERFLAIPSKPTWLVMLDNDTCPVNPAKGSWIDVLDEMEQLDLKCAGLPSPFFSAGMEGQLCYNCYCDNPDGTVDGFIKLADDWLMVDKIGGGGMIFAREVLEKMERPWFKLIMNPTTDAYDLSEDFYVSMQVRKLGYKIGVCGRYIMNHIHSIDFAYLVKSLSEHNLSLNNKGLVQMQIDKGARP